MCVLGQEFHCFFSIGLLTFKDYVFFLFHIYAIMFYIIHVPIKPVKLTAQVQKVITATCLC